MRSSLAREKRNQRESMFISKNLEMLGENQGKKRRDLEKGYYNWEWKRKHVEKMR